MLLVLGMRQEKAFHSNPKAEYCFKRGNLLSVVGNKQERLAFTKMAEAEAKQLPADPAVEKKP